MSDVVEEQQTCKTQSCQHQHFSAKIPAAPFLIFVDPGSAFVFILVFTSLRHRTMAHV